MTRQAKDREHLLAAVALADSCPSSATFRVGAVIIGPGGEIVATGYSGERKPNDHAEEVALSRIDADDTRLAGSTLYSSLEPCSVRASRPISCTELILDTAVPRIVFAWREPAIFVDCEGTEILRSAGREVIEIPDLAHLVRRTNAHVPGVET